MVQFTSVTKAVQIVAMTGVSTLALVTLPTVAVAQSDNSSVSEAGSGGIEDIVVTARKREETAQSIPGSILAISAQEIERRDFSSLEKIATSTPSFTIARASNGSGAQLSLRGVGSNFTSIGIEQSVATVVDGVYYGQGRIINEGLFDLERLEMLKGPQALFFGKNATAGVISITTANPTSDLYVRARAGYEFTANQIVGEFVVSAPLSDTLGARLAIKGGSMNGGYVKNVAGPVSYTSFDVATNNLATFTANPAVRNGPDEKELMGRLTLRWKPTDALTATAKASFTRQRNDNPSYNYVIFDCPAGGPAFVPGSPCKRDFVNAQNSMPQEIAANYPYAKSDGGLGNSYNSYAITTTIEYEADFLTLTNVSNYNRNKNIFILDGDYFSSNATNLWTTEKDTFRSYSNEFRVTSTLDGPLNFLAGAYYQNTKLYINNIVTLGGVEDSTVSAAQRYLAFDKESGTRGETLAAFGQLILKPTPQIELTGGARYTAESKNSYFLHPYVNVALQGVFLQNNRFTKKQNFTNVSPEFTIAYKPRPNLNIFAAYKTGYKSGGFSNTAIQSAFARQEDFDFEGEKARGFEAGIKGLFLDRQLSLDINLYSYKFLDLQVDFFNSAAISFVTTNAGSATTKGVEASFLYRPFALAGFEFRGGVNYNRARYKDYLAPCYAGQTPSQGCSLVVDGVPFQDISGQETANAPEWTGNLGMSYDWDIGSQTTAGVSVDARYSDAYIASAFGNLADRQRSYISLDASARLGFDNNRWEIAVIGRNLTNRFVLTGAFDVAGTGGGTGTAAGIPATQVGLASLPRTVQAQVTFRY
ncbi:MAG: TonB-dependent receptor [Novosphingobium sp.]